jgi:hypothetical protein
MVTVWKVKNDPHVEAYRKVHDDIHQEIVRKGLTFVIPHFQEQLQKVLLGGTVSFSSAFLDEFKSVVTNQIPVVLGLLTDTRQKLTDLPGWVL